MASDYNDNSILEMFGLSYEQSLLMFSAQKLIADFDVDITKNEKKANDVSIGSCAVKQVIKPEQK